MTICSLMEQVFKSFKNNLNRQLISYIIKRQILSNNIILMSNSKQKMQTKRQIKLLDELL